MILSQFLFLKRKYYLFIFKIFYFVNKKFWTGINVQGSSAGFFYILLSLQPGWKLCCVHWRTCKPDNALECQTFLLRAGPWALAEDGGWADAPHYLQNWLFWCISCGCLLFLLFEEQWCPNKKIFHSYCTAGSCTRVLSYKYQHGIILKQKN